MSCLDAVRSCLSLAVVDAAAPRAGEVMGFFATRSPLAACRRRVRSSCSEIPPIGGYIITTLTPWGSSCSEIPPIGGGAAEVRGGVAPTSQTTSVKNADNGLLVAKWSALWAVLGGMGCSRALSGAWPGW